MRAGGFGFILIIITALLIAFLSLKNMDSLGGSGSSSQGQQEVVNQTQDLVDQLNENIQEEYDFEK